jgi:hypothetical protein
MLATSLAASQGVGGCGSDPLCGVGFPRSVDSCRITLILFVSLRSTTVMGSCVFIRKLVIDYLRFFLSKVSSDESKARNLAPISWGK